MTAVADAVPPAEGLLVEIIFLGVSMDYNKAIAKTFMYNSLLRAVAFVCITVAAIYFQNTYVLWWYLGPIFMGISTKEKE